MSEAEQTNLLLYRTLKSGKEFEKLIPKPVGIDAFFEEANEYSDTYETLEYMAKWVSQYAYQFEKVAEILDSNDVLTTIENNYEFLYNHFQYKIDDSLENQTIYAPSKAWQVRKIGFDCKTFSVLASCLLTMQNIDHSFRKVRFDADDGWSHVYVVVPINGIDYVIDATKHENTEVGPIIEKYDYDMKQLRHRGLANPISKYPAIEEPFLACPSMNCGCGNSGLNSPYAIYPVHNEPFLASSLNGDTDQAEEESDDTTLWDDISGWFDGVNFNTPIDCWGGTSFDENLANNDMKNFTDRMNIYINNINTAVANKDFHNLALTISEMTGDATWNASISGYKRADQSWNSCSRGNIETVWKYFSFYRYNVVKSLMVWLNEYFNITIAGYRYFGNTNLTGATVKKYFIPNDVPYSASQSETSSTPVTVENVYYADWVSYDSNDGTYLVFQVPVYSISQKEIEAPLFEVSEVVIQSNNNANLLTPQNILDSLQDYSHLVGYDLGNDNNSGSDDYVTSGNSGTPSASNSSSGKIVKAVGFTALLGVGIWKGAKYFKNK